MQALKKLRGIIKGGALEFEEFHQLVRGLDVALISSVKDLRSQICREACITIRLAQYVHIVRTYTVDTVVYKCVHVCTCTHTYTCLYACMYSCIILSHTSLYVRTYV